MGSHLMVFEVGSAAYITVCRVWQTNGMASPRLLGMLCGDVSPESGAGALVC